MKTRTLTVKEALADRKWHIVDAAGIPLGRLSSEVATLLRGKHKPGFTPHVDCGDHVIVVNASQVKLTGKKLKDKVYYRHTGYVGGIKSITAEELLQRYPHRIIEKAVKGMLPRGALGHNIIKKLKVYSGAEHPHGAQTPASYELRHVSAVGA